MKRVILAFGIAVTWVAILYMTLAPEALAYNFIRGASGGSVAPLWATDQTLQMPYSCARYVWINPSTSPDGATGGGSLSPAQGGTGTGTQSHPFLTLSSLYATNGDVPVDAGTCINIVNSAPLIDDGDSTYFFWPGYLPAGHRGGDANDPTGYAILRSVDGDGNLVPAAGPGVTPDTVNTNAAHLILSSPTARYLYFATDGAPMGDYWIIDGLNIDAVGAMTTQNFNGCITLGDGNVNNWVPNQPAGPTHMMVRNSYIHGCGGAGIQTGGADWLSLQNNVITNNSGAPGFQESGIGIVVSQAGCPTYSLNCGPIQTGVDATIGTILDGQLIPFHQVITGNWVDSSAEFGQTGSHTDGNCIIMDTQTISQNSAPNFTNSGPYPYSSLIANNVMANCGGKGLHIFFNTSNVAVDNTLLADNLDSRLVTAQRVNMDCFFANGCISANNVSYAVGGNTTVRVAYTGGSTGPVSVDNVIPFLYSITLTQPSVLTPMQAIMQDTTANNVVGVTIDTTNHSTTPGGVSGTLTFSGTVSALNGDVGAVIQPQVYNTSNYNSTFAYFYAASDDTTGTIQTCKPWAQVTPLPCSGSSLLATILSGAGNQWYYNFWYGINGATGSIVSSSVPQVPPTLTSSPGFNEQATDPEFTDPSFLVSPSFILATLPNITASGSGYSKGCVVTLGGGSPTTAATIKVDNVSAGAISAFHLYGNGDYPTAANTSFTSSSASCGGSGATFSGGTYFQPFWISSARPDLTLQGGSPAKHGGSPDFCLSQDFTGTKRACPNTAGAYE